MSKVFFKHDIQLWSTIKLFVLSRNNPHKEGIPYLPPGDMLDSSVGVALGTIIRTHLSLNYDREILNGHMI